MTVTHPLGTIYAGASLSLTCTVELSSSVDVPVSVNTEWTGPDMTYFTPSNWVAAMMENDTSYISATTVDAARSGNYTCEATVSSYSTFVTGNETLNGSVDIIVGMSITQFSATIYSVILPDL